MAARPALPESLAHAHSRPASTRRRSCASPRYFQGQERGDQAAELLRQVERPLRGEARPRRLAAAGAAARRDRLRARGLPRAARRVERRRRAAQQADDLAALARLALRAGSRPLGWGAYDDEPYRWAARVDRTPGFWTGGVAFLLTGTDWKQALAQLESDSLAERTFATARALVAELATRAAGARRAAGAARRPDGPARGAGRGPSGARAAAARRERAAGRGRRGAPGGAARACGRSRRRSTDETRAVARAARRPRAPTARGRRRRADRYGKRLVVGGRHERQRPGRARSRPSRRSATTTCSTRRSSRLDQRDPLAPRGGRADPRRDGPAARAPRTCGSSSPSGSSPGTSTTSSARATSARSSASPDASWWARAARWYARHSRQRELDRLAEDLSRPLPRHRALRARPAGRPGAARAYPRPPRAGVRVSLVSWADWVRVQGAAALPAQPVGVPRGARARLGQASSTRPSSRSAAGPCCSPTRRGATPTWRTQHAAARSRRRLSRVGVAADPHAGRGAARVRGPRAAVAVRSRRATPPRASPRSTPATARSPRACSRCSARSRRSTRRRRERPRRSSRARAPALADPAPLWTELGELEHEAGRARPRRRRPGATCSSGSRATRRASNELATLLWDYGETDDALATIEDGRKRLGRPGLLAFEAGVLREEKHDVDGAIREYLQAGLPEESDCFCSAFERDQRVAAPARRS